MDTETNPLDIVDPNFDIVNKCVLHYFYMNRTKFTIFDGFKHWPPNTVKISRSNPELPRGSLTIPVNSHTLVTTDQYRNASTLSIMSYTPRIQDIGIVMSERKGIIRLFENGTIVGQDPETEYLNQNFNTCSQLLGILDGIFDTTTTATQSTPNTSSDGTNKQSRFTISDTLKRIEFVMSHIMS
jgi:hypothetical protein